MNEQIRKLAEEAELNVTLLFNKEKLEKFAKLIVMECIECVDGYTKPRTGNTEYDAVEQIKQHFGVE